MLGSLRAAIEPPAARVRDLLGLGASRVARIMDQCGTVDRTLTAVLAIWVGGLALAGVPELRATFPSGIDLEIVLRAATHWSAGAPVYPAAAMQVQSGPDLPFLYPPFLLPLTSPLASLPRDLVIDAWLVLCLAVAVWTCRRLGIPWIAVPCLLAWPPFAEGLIVGNVQILLFAAFVAVFYEPGDWAPEQRRLVPGRDLLNGVLAAAVGVLKFTQALPLLYLARRRLRAALLGVAALGVVVLATLPLTGLALYGDWLAQLQRAADPAWTIGGVSLTHRAGIPDGLLIGVGVVLAALVRGRDSAAWLGIALLVATPSVHGYTFLFLLPAMLTIRRDIAIPTGLLFLGVYHGIAWWLAWLIVTWVLVASTRWRWLRSPRRSDLPADGAQGSAVETAPAVAPVVATGPTVTPVVGG
jgi:hypothetical protein